MTRERFITMWSVKREQGPMKFILKLSFFIVLFIALGAHFGFRYSGINTLQYVRGNLMASILGLLFMFVIGLLIGINIWREHERRYMILTEEMPIAFEEV